MINTNFNIQIIEEMIIEDVLNSKWSKSVKKEDIIGINIDYLIESDYGWGIGWTCHLKSQDKYPNYVGKNERFDYIEYIRRLRVK